MTDLKINEIDSFLENVESVYQTSFEKAYDLFKDINLKYPDDLPIDPFSSEYRERIYSLYKKISGKKSYQLINEENPIDIQSAIYKPYPYLTNSLLRVSMYHNLLSKLMSLLDVDPGGSILDMGSGWGTTSLELANTGFNVTALDVSKSFCNLISKRAELMQLNNLDVVNDDFFWVNKTQKKFDAIVFFESFHHCWDFERLLKSLHEVINPGGKIYFAAEPIAEKFPIPWTLRLDGESLFVVKKYGWMELGFTPSFFEELLYRNGWEGICVEDEFWKASQLHKNVINLASSSYVNKKTFYKQTTIRLKIWAKNLLKTFLRSITSQGFRSKLKNWL